MDVTFEDAKYYLQDKLPQKAEKCAFKLFSMLNPIEALRTAKTYFPKDYKDSLAGKAYQIKTVWSQYRVEEDVYGLLRRHFGVMEMAVERTEESRGFQIPIEPIGPQWSWDTFSEDLGSLDNISDWAGPGILIQMLDHEWNEEWEAVIKRFNWPIEEPPEFPDERWWVDLDVLYQKFKTHGLRCLIWLWKVNTWTTGNIYWDLNMYDETTIDEDVFEPKDIPNLLRAWRRAQRIGALFEAGNQMVLDNPDLIPLQIKLFKEAIKIREEKEGRQSEGA